MIAKGHDVANVRRWWAWSAPMQPLAFLIFAGRLLHGPSSCSPRLPDAPAAATTPGKVVLQTFFPDHYAIQFAAAHDYHGFYEKELRFRSWMHYPPFSTASQCVLVRSHKLEESLAWSGILGKWFESTRLEGVRVMGPAAAAIVRLKTEYRYHFLLKSPSRERMNAVLRAMLDHATAQKIPRNNLVVDVDADAPSLI